MPWLAIGRFGRWRLVLITAAVLVLAASALLALLLSDQSATITGHVYHCDSGMATPAARACAPGEPVGNLILRFELVDGTRSFVVSTDSNGAYSVSVVPGTYIVKWEVVGSAKYSDAGRVYVGTWDLKPFLVKRGQHLVLDLTSHSATQ